jgi:hypothetical protein
MSKSAGYTADNGIDYAIVVPDWVDDIAITVTGLKVPTGSESKVPSGIEFRGVWVKDATNLKRRFIPCGPDGTLYKSNSSQTVTFSGESWTSTGRIGERLTFTSLAPIDAAAA